MTRHPFPGTLSIVLAESLQLYTILLGVADPHPMSSGSLQPPCILSPSLINYILPFCTYIVVFPCQSHYHFLFIDSHKSV